jgi:ubiquinone/menaquinone biosynthesis C-methylase UbiE
MNDSLFAYNKFNKIFINDFIYDENKSIYHNTEVILEKIVQGIKLLPRNISNYLSCHTALRIQYYFDFSVKSQRHPKSFINNLSNILDEICMYQSFANSGWFIDEKLSTSGVDEWKLTRMAFNSVWPKTTSGANYDASLNMAILRLDQIIDAFPEIFHNSMSVLDSGCGPARYSAALSRRFPNSDFYGLDSGEKIIESNRNLFSSKNFHFDVGLVSDLPYSDEKFDLVMSVGVLHHSDVNLKKTIAEHFRVLKKGGALFIFIVGADSIEMLMWKYLRKLMRDIDHNMVLDLYSSLLIPLRTQGMIDHCYGEYFETPLQDLMEICKQFSSKHHKVLGIPGLDVTHEAMSNDPYFKERFGDGQLRYIFIKN